MMFGIGVLSFMITVTPTWVLERMQRLQPETHVAWRHTYQETATAIADAANAEPLWTSRADGAQRTAALLVAIAYHESRFNPTAIGDHGSAFGLYQIHVGAIPEAKTANSFLLPRDASILAIHIIRESFRVCAPEPPRRRLGNYAYGRGSCGDERSKRNSEMKFRLADEILKEEP